ncbi:MAG: OsmC family protein [Micromonosporaceae bacterium]
MPTRNASAAWNGELTSGNGTMRLGSGAYEGPYSFSSRFQDGGGTNPEELIGAALAGCFSMALANTIAKAGHQPESVETTADVHLTKDDAGFSISRIDLTTTGRVPGLAADEFAKHADATRTGCIVARALGGVEVTVDATLAS